MPSKKDDNDRKKLIPSEKKDNKPKKLIPSEKKDSEPKNLDTGNVFDRIFRENSPRMIAWIERRFGYQIKEYELLKEKIAKTLEREIDFLCKIITKTDKILLLHMEFQSADNNEMVYRMQEYHALISRKYKLPVRQIVMYLGEEESKMITQLPATGVYTGFELVSIHKIDIEEFISDQFPEIIILALLSNYEKDHIEKVLHTIVGNIKKTVKHKDTLNRYINQLLLFSRLRNLEKTVTKILEDMPITYEIDIEKDYLYKRGVEKGIEKKEIQAIIGCFEVGNDVKTIAKALNISQKRVKQVIEEWKKSA